MMRLLGLAAILSTGVVLDAPNTSPAQEADYGRQCLALAAYSEARGDGDLAMAAVMRVVLNRATDPFHRWPQTICDVVLQPGQFAGVDGWPYPRIATDHAAWDRALELADDAIADRDSLPADCEGATSFQRSDKAQGLTPLCRIASHTFYAEPGQRLAAP